MARPQQPELRRSETTHLQPDSIESELQARRRPDADGDAGPVPGDNQPGHHPAEEQDKPDMAAFVRRFSTGRQADDGATGDDGASAAADRSSRRLGGVVVAAARVVGEAAVAGRDVARVATRSFRQRDITGVVKVPAAIVHHVRIIVTRRT